MKFSIVVPVYNIENYIEDCVLSLVKQKVVDDFEILLVNDGSRDHSEEVCLKLSNMFQNVHLYTKENGGLSDARNYGILKSVGDYILFIDGDDWIKYDDLLYKASSILNEKEYDYILFGACKFDEKSQKYLYEKQVDLSEITDNYDKNLLYLIASQTYSMSACTKIVKREFLLEHNLFFEKGIYSEDLDWYLRFVMYAKSVYAIPGDYYVYRQRADSITTSIKEKNFIDNINILKKFSLVDLKGHSPDFINAFYGMLAYAYVMDILVFSKLENSVKQKNYQELKKFKYLLKYSVNKRILITRIFSDMFSLKFMAYILPWLRNIKIYIKGRIVF